MIFISIEIENYENKLVMRQRIPLDDIILGKKINEECVYPLNNFLLLIDKSLNEHPCFFLSDKNGMHLTYLSAEPCSNKFFNKVGRDLIFMGSGAAISHVELGDWCLGLVVGYLFSRSLQKTSSFIASNSTCEIKNKYKINGIGVGHYSRGEIALDNRIELFFGYYKQTLTPAKQLKEGKKFSIENMWNYFKNNYLYKQSDKDERKFIIENKVRVSTSYSPALLKFLRKGNFSKYHGRTDLSRCDLAKKVESALFNKNYFLEHGIYLGTLQPKF